jgi:dGTPase
MSQEEPVLNMNRQALEAQEEKFLASYAVHSSKTLGRRHSEEEHDFRKPFQRDRDRVIHSGAFRRLEYKTQVFVNTEGDYYRTRLTHTLETAQIARTLARNLCLNEDLVEASALCHDLGHTPFGHAGQEIMNELMQGQGGFEHNLQSLRIVDELEKRYPQFPGLNLCEETREAIAKHSPERTQGFPEGWPSLEGQLVDVVDSIAYLAADLDDGLHSGILRVEELVDLELFRKAHEKVKKKVGFFDMKLYRRPLISEIINLLVQDLLSQTTANLKQNDVRNLCDVRQAQGLLVTFSQDMGRAKGKTHEFLQRCFYGHWRVRRMAVRAQKILTSLFETFVAHPDILPPEHQENCHCYGVEKGVCDYIAGMTDRFALEEVSRLNLPSRN